MIRRPFVARDINSQQAASKKPADSDLNYVKSQDFVDAHLLYTLICEEPGNHSLEKFYDSVRMRVHGVDNSRGRQKLIVQLYDTFFATAFKKTVDRLDIVYTPVQIVDCILRSADNVLREDFGQGLTDDGVHVLDGFTGTGTFMLRLLQLGLIQPHDLARKYATELLANEILLLAYYIAAVNMRPLLSALLQ